MKDGPCHFCIDCGAEVNCGYCHCGSKFEARPIYKAAPDLLDALKDCMEVMLAIADMNIKGEKWECGCREGRICYTHLAASEAEKSIAKAEGK